MTSGWREQQGNYTDKRESLAKGNTPAGNGGGGGLLFLLFLFELAAFEFGEFADEFLFAGVFFFGHKSLLSGGERLPAVVSRFFIR